MKTVLQFPGQPDLELKPVKQRARNARKVNRETLREIRVKMELARSCIAQFGMVGRPQLRRAHDQLVDAQQLFDLLIGVIPR